MLTEKAWCPFAGICAALFILLFSTKSMAQEVPAQSSEGTENTLGRPETCAFDLVIPEPEFCVVQGMVRDVDISLVQREGTCEEAFAIDVKGLPSGVTRTIFPASPVKFINGLASATLRIDTASITQDRMATSSLVLSASNKEVSRSANAEMVVDLPFFDFSIKSVTRMIAIPEKDVKEDEKEDEKQNRASANSEEQKQNLASADHAARKDKEDDLMSVDVDVELLGAACQVPQPVMLSLDTPFIPPIITHEFSSQSVIPTGKTSVAFKISSESAMSEYYGTYEVDLVGCCTDRDMEPEKGEKGEKREKLLVALMPSFLSNPLPSPTGPGAEEIAGFPMPGGEPFRVDSFENIVKAINLPHALQEKSRKAAEELATKGYIEVSEEKVQRLRESMTHVLPMDRVLGRLTFWPADLQNTPFRQLHLAGGYPWGGEDQSGYSMRVSRLFTTSNGAIIELSENDLATSGGGTVYSKEAINEDVHGFPAVFIVEQSPTGNAISSLVWTTNRTDYNFEMEGNVRQNGQYNFFVNLARSIPLQDNRPSKTQPVKGPGPISKDLVK